MVTRRQVAERANVSEATVSNVINGKACVSEDKTRRVMKAINELNYVPDQNARTLVMGKSRHIGIAIYETTNPYHMELARHIESHATKRGYIVSLFMLDNNMKNKLDVIVQHRLDGIINFMTNQYPGVVKRSQFLRRTRQRFVRIVTDRSVTHRRKQDGNLQL